ncbi:hypothetical protein [Vibrio neonatus]
MRDHLGMSVQAGVLTIGSRPDAVLKEYGAMLEYDGPMHAKLGMPLFFK